MTRQKVAVIFGVTGQDGAFLSRFLLEKNYKVIGVARRSSCNNKVRLNEFSLFNKYNDNFIVLDGDITDYRSVHQIFKTATDLNLKLNTNITPIEIYNLAAMSDVGISFNQPEVCFDINTKGVLNILQEMTLAPSLFRLYQAGTSEQFGSNVDPDGFQRETTQFHPRSPYAVSKVAAHHLVQNYREAYKLHASVGVLFNHESFLRGENFLSRKVTKYVGQLYTNFNNPKNGEFNKLQLGNLNSSRDWGYAGDYIKAMYLMLQKDKPDDFVIATGETHSVEELVISAFKCIGIKDFRSYVDISPSLIRPSEVDYLKGDSSKARKELGWSPEVNFEQLIRKMVQHDISQ